MGEVNTELFLNAIPAARSKLLIDMVNCLDVADGHIRVAIARENSFSSRLFDGLSGKAQRRSNSIAKHQQTSLRNVIEVTKDLAQHVAHGHRVLSIVGDRLKTLEESLALLAHAVADQREAVQTLRVDMRNGLARIDEGLARLNMHTAAQDQIQWVFSRWDAGAWNALPVAGRCYVAMNELNWGHFGEYFRSHPGERGTVLLETVQSQAMARMQRDANIGPHIPLALKDWLSPASEGSRTSHLFAEGLAWLGEMHQLNDPQPIAYLCTQWHTLDEKPQLPNTIPRLLHAQRLTGLVTDIFFEDERAQHAQ